MSSIDDNRLVMCNYSIIYNTCLNKMLYSKVTPSPIAKLTPRVVFNLKAWECIHCEEETDTNRGIFLHTNTLVIFFLIKEVDF